MIEQYFSGHITRNELMLKARNIKPKVLCYAEYCSYKFVVLNDIVQVLSEIPELSYSDDELKDILEILETNGSAFTRPWFGQLMTGPQLMAYLCQVNMWLEKYEPKIEI